MKILIVEPGKHPRVEEIPHTLEKMQETVGGRIQATFPWRDPVALVCDEEGMLKGCELNRVISDRMAIVGTFFLCGAGDEDFEDLSPEMIDKYTALLYDPI